MGPKRKRITACDECHKKKIRCSADGPPCRTCEVAQLDCVYPQKDKKIKVGQRYLDAILDENRRLNDAVTTLSPSRTSVEVSTPLSRLQRDAEHLPSVAQSRSIGNQLSGSASETGLATRTDDSDRNPIVDQHAWFVPVGTVDLPVHIGVAADAAFATRLRQAVSDRSIPHLPRVHYMSDNTLYDLQERVLQWPNAARMRFLVDVALKVVCSRWHTVRRSVVLANVASMLRSPSSCDRLTQCQICALLALGEAFSSRCVVGAFPGSQYWTKAMSMITIIPERPRLEVVEIYLLLGIYASCLNRRHTSIILASSAVRICTILGLHLEIDKSQLQDPVLREHRCRLWWTAYRCDRLWASKIGWPPSIPDESIEIGYPAAEGLPVEAQTDFEDAEYAQSAIKLAGLLNHAITTLYVRRRHETPFIERVQAAIRSLKNWSESLPTHLRLNLDNLPDNVSDHLLYLHLAFNQAVIVIIRPVLLHRLKQRGQGFSESATSLTTACISRARQSMNMLRRAWTDGTFQTFDYFFAQFLFSAAVILGLSALLREPSWQDDRQDFLLASSFLHQLEQNGNFGAREFCNHIDALEVVLQALLSENVGTVASANAASETSAMQFSAAEQTAQDIVAQPPLHDLLDIPDLNADSVNVAGDLFDWQDLFLPDMQALQ